MAYKILIFVWTAVVYCLYTYATITTKSISDFNIGILFASYDLEYICKSPVQFVMAKKSNAGVCQWKIADDFAKQKVGNETELPVADIGGNCLFSCNFLADEPKMTAELQLLSFFSKSTSVKKSDYDLYTYLAPCDRTIRGNVSEGDSNRTKALEDFAGVYYTSNADDCKGLGTEVLNDAVLRNDSNTGLFAARKNTQVDVRRVQEAIKEIKEDKSKLSALRYESEWLYNAVAAYFDQHPPKKILGSKD